MKTLYLTPELVNFFALYHDRTTCDDRSYGNYGRCTRCDLLYKLNYPGYLESDDIVSFSLKREY